MKPVPPVMITLTFSDFLAGGMAVRLETSLSDGERIRALLVGEVGE